MTPNGKKRFDEILVAAGRNKAANFAKDVELADQRAKADQRKQDIQQKWEKLVDEIRACVDEVNRMLEREQQLQVSQTLETDGEIGGATVGLASGFGEMDLHFIVDSAGAIRVVFPQTEKQTHFPALDVDEAKREHIEGPVIEFCAVILGVESR